jgi:hypothetical protein
MDDGKVTRFEVIDETGRAYVRDGVSVCVSYQDDGRTLKVFVKELPLGEGAAARASHAANLAEVLFAGD